MWHHLEEKIWWWWWWGGYSGKCTYIFGGVFWEMHIHFLGEVDGGILGNAYTFSGGGIMGT